VAGMVFSDYTKQRIIFYYHQELKPRIRSGGSSKITPEIKQLIESKMRADDETTAMQLHQMLTSRGYNLSKRTYFSLQKCPGMDVLWQRILPADSAYCQLIAHTANFYQAFILC